LFKTPFAKKTMVAEADTAKSNTW